MWHVFRRLDLCLLYSCEILLFVIHFLLSQPLYDVIGLQFTFSKKIVLLPFVIESKNINPGKLHPFRTFGSGIIKNMI